MTVMRYKKSRRKREGIYAGKLSGKHYRKEHKTYYCQSGKYVQVGKFLATWVMWRRRNKEWRRKPNIDKFGHIGLL